MLGASAGSFFERVRAALLAGSSVASRIGTFYLEVYPGYDGRNPRTGEVVKVPPKKVFYFAASDELGAAAFADGAAETFAEADARLREIADGGATVLPSVAVACDDDGFGEIARALRALGDEGELSVPHLGTFTLRRRVDRVGGVVKFHAADDAKAALNPESR